MSQLTTFSPHLTSCIICCDNIIPSKSTDSNAIPSTKGEKESTSHLTHLFRTFCKYNNWENSELEYDFENDLFPFCSACRLDFVVQIYNLDNCIETILTQIRQIVTKVSSKIVLSELQRTKSGRDNFTYRNNNCPSQRSQSMGGACETDFEGGSLLQVNRTNEKNMYFRSLTLTRCSPNVSLNSQAEDGREDEEDKQLHNSHVPELVKLEDDSDVESESDDSINLPQSPLSTSEDANNIKCEILIKEEPEESLTFLTQRQIGGHEPNLDCNSESSLPDPSGPSLPNSIPSASSPEEACSKPKGNKCVQISSTKFIYAEMYPFEVIENRFQCGSCSFFTLKKRCNLLQHIRSNHMSGVQKHICQTCGKSYSNKICYKFHLETHTDTPSYTCEFCGKEFKLIYNYRSHKRYSHGGDDLKKYVCKYCGKKFWKNREMTLHSKIHTERHVPKTTCKICGEVVEKKIIDLHVKELHFS